MNKNAPAKKKKVLPTSDKYFLIVASEMFKALADTTRLRILDALSDGERSVQALSEELEASHSAISHQLAVLRGNRLVTARRAGREVFYSLQDEHVMSLVEAAVKHAQERP